MKDPRLKILAKNLLQYSVHLEPGEFLLIKGHTKAIPLIKELISECYRLSAFPYVDLADEEINRALMLENSEERIEKDIDWQKEKYLECDAFIIIDAMDNDSELSDVQVEVQMLASRLYRNLNDLIYTIGKKWVLLIYPNSAKAQKAGMSTESFEDFVLEVSSMDYAKMKRAMLPLKKRLEQTDKVRITAPGTDLSFSIKDISAIPCAGENNIPDGEIFTAPVKNSVNGIITFNTPSPYQGTVFKQIRLTFSEGKIVRAEAANDSEKLNRILDTDEGARYIGEFALGLNPLITKPLGDILFDEKIAGSLHFTPGACYEGEADNGNHSAIHWDLVLVQTEEFGGGDIFFDDELIRHNGRFVLPELIGLNPEKLL